MFVEKKKFFLIRKINLQLRLSRIVILRIIMLENAGTLLRRRSDERKYYRVVF